MRLKEFFSHKKKEEEEESNPFNKPRVKHKEEDKASFRYYLKQHYGSFNVGIEKRFGGLAEKKIHVRFLRQTKRVIGTVYFFLFLMLALVSNSSWFFFLFLGAAYLMLDYLWKSRKVVWEKK